MLMSLGAVLFLKGRGNADDVIGLLEKLLAIVVLMVVLFVNQNLLLETLAVIAVLQLPIARRQSPS